MMVGGEVMNIKLNQQNRFENKDFVIRRGSKFILDNKDFRFGGPNVYWLGLDENVGGIEYPTEFRVNNVLDTAVEMGATTIRSHTLGISFGNEKTVQPKLGVFNEEAFKKIDYAIKAIGERGLRVIIPLVDNWDYYHGGRETFTKWRGLNDPNEFYYHPDVILDYKNYIHAILNRVNTYTNVAYKDDPAILAWEVGNELVDAPIEWVEGIVNYIKSIDNNHLVGYGNRFGLDEEKLLIEQLDFLDAHYYGINSEQLMKDANAAKQANKAFIVGEFGWTDDNLESFLKTAEENIAVSGTLYWSLFGHNDKSGYVEHFDSFTLHYPGLYTSKDRAHRIQLLREHGFSMSNRPITEHKVPDAPKITEVTDVVRWRGVVGAAYYSIERSTSGENGPWETICEKHVSDHHLSWTDTSRDLMTKAWYRIKALNISGIEGKYSKVYCSKMLSHRSSLVEVT